MTQKNARDAATLPAEYECDPQSLFIRAMLQFGDKEAAAAKIFLGSGLITSANATVFRIEAPKSQVSMRVVLGFLSGVLGGVAGWFALAALWMAHSGPWGASRLSETSGCGN